MIEEEQEEEIMSRQDFSDIADSIVKEHHATKRMKYIYRIVVVFATLGCYIFTRDGIVLFALLFIYV